MANVLERVQGFQLEIHHQGIIALRYFYVKHLQYFSTDVDI